MEMMGAIEEVLEDYAFWSSKKYIYIWGMREEEYVVCDQHKNIIEHRKFSCPTRYILGVKFEFYVFLSSELLSKCLTYGKFTANNH